MKVSQGRYVYHAEWESPRRETIAQADLETGPPGALLCQDVLEEQPRPFRGRVPGSGTGRRL